MKKILLVFLALSVFLFFSYQAYGQGSSSDNGIILFMQGDVKVKTAKSNIWSVAEKGLIISNGDAMKTGKNSWAEIAFGKNHKNSVRVQSETEVVFNDLGATKINLLKGELRSLVEKVSKNRVYEIKTPVSVCGIRGTGFDSITDGNTAETDVFENSVFFSGLGEDSQGNIIDEGKMGLLDEMGNLSIEDLPQDKMDNWDKWKEDFEDRRETETGSTSEGEGGGEDNIENKIQDIATQQDSTEGAMNTGKDATFETGLEDKINKELEDRAPTGTSNDDGGDYLKR